jgi:hypothetical protein
MTSLVKTLGENVFLLRVSSSHNSCFGATNGFCSKTKGSFAINSESPDKCMSREVLEATQGRGSGSGVALGSSVALGVGHHLQVGAEPLPTFLFNKNQLRTMHSLSFS